MIKKSFHKAADYKKCVIGLCIVLLVITADFIVYKTGGTQFAYTHIMYIPILISAAVFGYMGSIGTAILAGLTLGPFMPANVSDGVYQNADSWLLRTTFFVFIGLIVSFLFNRINSDKEMRIKRSYEHVRTGYPNINKLKLDLNEIKTEKGFSIVVFRIANYDYINRYIDYKTGDKMIFKVMEILANVFQENTIYSANTNEMVVLMNEYGIDAACSKASLFLSHFIKPVSIEGLPVGIVIKCGIVNYPLHGRNVSQLLTKLGRTLDQEESTSNGICIYDDRVAQKRKEYYETVVSIFNAIKNNDFAIVYQPKINLIKNEIIGLEALLRWDNGKKGRMNPEEFIKIAEDAGIISEITKWVIKNVIDQLVEWKEDGIKTRIAINISSKDLKDDSIIEYTKKLIDASQIDPTMLEFELTERTIVENEKQVGHLLNQIKNNGLKISLDDFGTGYNSLINLSLLPIDYIKIDKMFINNLQNIRVKAIMKGTIDLIHGLGKEVIVEGVETAEQVDALSEMGCDNIQGYYFSRPLPPEEIKQYILNYNNYDALTGIYNRRLRI